MKKGMKSLFFIVLFVLPLILFAQTGDKDLLPGSINSYKVDYAPSISADNNTLIFQSNREGRYKLYEAKRNQDGTWGEPVSIDAINEFGDPDDLIGGPSISYDGNLLYFFASFDGGSGGDDIYYSVRENGDWSKPNNMGRRINSGQYDGFPSISADGNQLYFMRATKRQDNASNTCYYIMMATKDNNGRWGGASKLAAPINMGCEKITRIMSDSETMYFASIREESVAGSYDLYMSRLQEDETWGTPIPMTFINTQQDDISASVPSRGDIIYINNMGEADQDLFSAEIPEEFRPKIVINVQGTITDENTGKPLAATIRMVRDEKEDKAKVYANNPSDGAYTIVLVQSYIYNVTYSAPGYQTKNDVYDLRDLDKYELKKKDIQLRLLEADLLVRSRNAVSKKPITEFEVAVKNIDTEEIIPVSNDQGTLKTHLVNGPKYLIKVSKEGFQDTTFTYRLDLLEDKGVVREDINLKPNQPKLILTITDEETGESIPTKVSVYNSIDKKVVFDAVNEKKTLEVDLEYHKYYKIKVLGNKYFYYLSDLNLKNVFEGVTYEREVKMKAIKKGAKLTLDNITFAFNSAELNDSSMVELKEIYGLLRKYKNLVVEIAAHTDDIGSDEANQKLSEARAQSVVSYLREKGVPASMLSPVGYGEKDPAVPNTDDLSRARNRRVEFRILDLR